MELGRNINPSTVHGFKRVYLQELNQKRRAEEDDLTVTSLPAKKRGHPLLKGEELKWKIQLYLKAIWESGGAVNTAIALGAARGIILKLNRTMLVENGGHVDLTKAWWGMRRKGKQLARARILLRTLKSSRHHFWSKCQLTTVIIW